MRPLLDIRRAHEHQAEMCSDDEVVLDVAVQLIIRAHAKAELLLPLRNLPYVGSRRAAGASAATSELRARSEESA